jgi:hypothetical protein
MEPEREQAAGEGLARRAHLLVYAAAVVFGEEAAGPVRPLADARVAGVAGYGLEGVAGRAFGQVLALAVEPFGMRAPVGVHLAGAERDVPPAAAATPALPAREALLGIEA